MGRKRKFQLGDVANWADQEWVVIVDWQRRAGKGMYRCIRLQHPLNGLMYGAAFYALPQDLYPTTQPNRFRSTVKIYKANERLEERGCTCNCCAHVEIPVSDIRSDGTFRWEQTDE